MAKKRSGAATGTKRTKAADAAPKTTGRGKGPRATQMRVLVREGLGKLRSLQLGYDFSDGETNKTALGLNTVVTCLESLNDGKTFEALMNRIETQVTAEATPRETVSSTLFD